MERVSIIEGTNPYIILAPHGPDDDYTAEMAEYMAEALECYAVINWGWERSDQVDYLNDQANCNNIDHLHEDVVKDEFLDPILKFTNKIKFSSNNPFTNNNNLESYNFILHGFGTLTSSKTKPDIVVGHGNGKPNSQSCDSFVTNAFNYSLMRHGFDVCYGKIGGQYSGWARNNLNQLYRKWYPDRLVNSLQLEIHRDLRDTDQIAINTAERLVVVIEDLFDHMKNNHFPHDWEKIISTISGF